MGSIDDGSEDGGTFIDEVTPTDTTVISPPDETATTGTETPGTTAPEGSTDTASDTPQTTDGDDTATEPDQETDTETGTETETETQQDTETPMSRQLRIIAESNAGAFEYSFMIDGEAELVTTGEYHAVPIEETANGRGEEIVDNGDGSVTIKGWVAGGGGDTFRFTGELTHSDIHGPASVYLDGELVEESDSSPGISSCRTIDEPGEYVLTDDLSGSTDVCIDIRADDVILDGDGHTIAGSNGQRTGIAAIGSRVVVRNVTVRGFEVGMDLDGTTVENAVVTENGTGINVLSPGDGGSVVGCEISRNDEDGIVIEGSEGDRVVVRDNRLVANGRYGVRITASDVDVVGNAIEENGEWGVWADDSEVFFDSNEVRSNQGGIHIVGRGILDNEIVTENDGTGVVVAGEAELRATSIRDNQGDGLQVAPSPALSGRATLERCHITANEGNGIDAEVDLTVRESDIAENGTSGIQYAGEGTADARNNFWGSSDGPSSPDDPDAPFKDPVRDAYADGSGDAVSEGATPGVSNVQFTPWRSSSI